MPPSKGIYNIGLLLNTLTYLLLHKLQMFTGDLWCSHRFFLQYLWKRAVRIKEKPYTTQMERLCTYVVGKPCNIHKLWRNPILSYHRVFHALSNWYLYEYNLNCP